MDRSKRSGSPYPVGTGPFQKELDHHEDQVDFRVSQAVHEICRNYGSACRRLTGRSLRTLEGLNRRGVDRNEIMVPFYLYPARGRRSSDGTSPPALIAVTRDLSERGIGFRCDLPITDTYFIAEFDSARDGMIRMLLEVCWVKKQGLHDYLAGGRIVRLLEDRER